MSFNPFSFLYFILKGRLMRKASVAILLLCLAFITAEIKGAGNGLFDKLKLPPPPPVPEKQAVVNETPVAQPAESAEPNQPEQVKEQPDTDEPHPRANYAQSLETLNFHEGEFDWRKDWWKALLLTLGALAAATLLMRIAKQLIRYIIMTVCLAAGSFGARYFGPPLTPWLETKLPSFLVNVIPALYWSYLLVFLICYILATIILLILKGPLDIMDKDRKSPSGAK
ncbi:MAG: hypothetical protein K5787_01670 [Lentisphaeria bacterium]|nr:hypothetical protein [Lentisphaeria bacterium]